MGLGKTSSVVAYYGRAAASAAGSTLFKFKLLSTTTQSQSRTRTRTCQPGRECCGRPGVLYIDRGVIVLNKPPGLVSQGTSSVEAPTVVTAKSHRHRHRHHQETTTLPQATSSRTAFDDVLDGTVTNSFLSSLLRLFYFRARSVQYYSIQ
jgi:hypothetical protein